jgi:hypothetical protein
VQPSKQMRTPKKMKRLMARASLQGGESSQTQEPGWFRERVCLHPVEIVAPANHRAVFRECFRVPAAAARRNVISAGPLCDCVQALKRILPMPKSKAARLGAL